jgi:SAM-dependent methyltransferase
VAGDTSWAGEMPEVYDRALGPAVFAPVARELARRVARLSPGRVLELAAGTGIATAELLRAVPGVALVATDLNDAMVRWGAGRVPGATWRQADALALDETDASYDVVVCQFGVMFFPDRSAGFAEAARVLVPGGMFVFTVWDEVRTSTLTVAFMAALAEVLPVDTPDFLVRIPHGYADVGRIQADLRAGGLEPVEVERIVPRGSSPSAAVVAEGFCQGTPLRFALQDRGDLHDLTMRVAESLTRRLGDGPVEGDLGTYLVSARRPS